MCVHEYGTTYDKMNSLPLNVPKGIWLLCVSDDNPVSMHAQRWNFIRSSFSHGGTLVGYFTTLVCAWSLSSWESICSAFLSPSHIMLWCRCLLPLAHFTVYLSSVNCKHLSSIAWLADSIQRSDYHFPSCPGNACPNHYTCLFILDIG